jgi:alkylhydroperoxidase family enzyme
MVLGRSAGIAEDKLARIGEDPLPDSVYEADEAAIIRYARASSRIEPITDELYNALAAHFDTRQLIEICMTVGLSNLINRFHATFLTDLDEAVIEAMDQGPPGSP